MFLKSKEKEGRERGATSLVPSLFDAVDFYMYNGQEAWKGMERKFNGRSEQREGQEGGSQAKGGRKVRREGQAQERSTRYL